MIRIYSSVAMTLSHKSKGPQVQILVILNVDSENKLFTEFLPPTITISLGLRGWLHARVEQIMSE